MKRLQKHILPFFIVLLQVAVYAQTPVQVLDTAVIKDITVSPEHIINTVNAEYGPAYYGDNIGYVYSSSRGRQVDKEIDEPFYDLGYAARDTSGLLALSASFSTGINSLGHEGPFDVNGENIYFTRVIPTKINGKQGYTRKIYRGEIYGDGYEPMSFSTDDVMACHPTLSEDGLTMIFAGDFEATGKMDLYKSSFIGEEWSKPERLVGDINSEEHELFPNLIRDSILVFTSTRVGGLGGYDQYASVYRGGRWTAPQHLPSPINSQWDDFGMIIRGDGKKGYFASNRPGGEGKDDIYNFKSLKSIFYKAEAEKVEVRYTVLDKLRFVPIKNASIKITELTLTQDKLELEDYNVDLKPGADEGELLIKLSPKKGIELPTAMTDEDGRYFVKLAPKRNYIVTATAPEYESSTFIYQADTYGPTLDIVLEPKAPAPPVVQAPPPTVYNTPVVKESEPEVIEINKKKGGITVFENLYYDRNSAQIMKGSAAELDALADAMLLNPSMEVLLIAHTDSRGDDNYNLLLSEERALSARNYLRDRGIKSSRISTRGSGEKEIRNRCKNGVKCNDEEHRYNRRTEVRVLRI